MALYLDEQGYIAQTAEIPAVSHVATIAFGLAAALAFGIVAMVAVQGLGW